MWRLRLQCGVFVSMDEDPENAGFDILSRSTKDHMQWNVKVHVDYGAAGWSVRGGTLVKPNMVLTCESLVVIQLNVFCAARTCRCCFVPN